jgi:hypothetical protein
MHFNLRRGLGIATPVLLVTAVAVGAAALPAMAQTWQDSGLFAFPVQIVPFAGASLEAANGTGVIKLSGTGVTWSLHGTPPSGVSLSGTTISYSGGAVKNPPDIVADARDNSGNADALVIPVALTAQSIQVSGTVVTVSLSALADSNTSAGTVKFSANSSKSTNSISFAESGLPSGLVSGNPVLSWVGATAAPGTYGGVIVTATDVDGAALNGVFTLNVYANSTATFGDEVNPFGNGFDSFRRHQYPGAIIAGWTATQADPATHFIRSSGTYAGAYRFEYAPSGKGSGLCVSDPGGGWASDPLPDGLILARCNTGPWQQFIPGSNGTLRDVATGLYVNPNGKGAQLRGDSAPSPWGGSIYNWTGVTQLAA